MLAFFIITTIILAILLAVMIVQLKHRKKVSTFWYEKWRQSEADYVGLSVDYEALEVGNNEIEENYQQEILSLYDMLEAKNNSAIYWQNIAEELEKIRLDHDTYCLPVLGKDFYPNAEEDDTPLFGACDG